jgi:hypothetical protein
MSRFNNHGILFLLFVYSVLMALFDLFSIAIGKTDVQTSLLGHWVASWDTVMVNVFIAILAYWFAGPWDGDEKEEHSEQ